MSLSRDNLLELMALADGELEGEAKGRAEELLLESQEARRVVDAMRSPELGAWLRASSDERAAAADGIVDDVMARIGAPPGGSAVVLPGRRGRRPSRAALSVVAAGSLALAAGVALYVRSVDSRNGEQVTVAGRGAPGADAFAKPSAALVLAGAPRNGGVEVNEIDSPSRGVSVFEIPAGAAGAAVANAAGPSSVVIWIDDDPGIK